MKHSPGTEEQIIGILKEQEAIAKLAERLKTTPAALLTPGGNRPEA